MLYLALYDQFTILVNAPRQELLEIGSLVKKRGKDYPSDLKYSMAIIKVNDSQALWNSNFNTLI